VSPETSLNSILLASLFAFSANMFMRIVTLVFLLQVSLSVAFQLNNPATEFTSGNNCTVTWALTSGDTATFDLDIVDVYSHNITIIQRAVESLGSSLTFLMPSLLPGPNYTMVATMPGNANDVLSTIGPFTIGAFTNVPPPSSVSSTETSIIGHPPPPVTGGGFGHTISASLPRSDTETSTSAGSPTSSISSPGLIFNGASYARPERAVAFAAVVLLIGY